MRATQNGSSRRRQRGLRWRHVVSNPFTPRPSHRAIRVQSPRALSRFARLAEGRVRETVCPTANSVPCQPGFERGAWTDLPLPVILIFGYISATARWFGSARAPKGPGGVGGLGTAHGTHLQSERPPTPESFTRLSRAADVPGWSRSMGGGPGWLPVHLTEKSSR